MKKIVCVRRESHTDTGVVDKWVAYFNNGEVESYEVEVPPVSVSMFCVKAKYGYKSIYGVDMTDWWMNDHRLKDRYC